MKVEKTTHSSLGASSSKRWMTCAGSPRLTKDLPNPSSSYAREGTAAHEICEKCLTWGKNAEDFLGTQVQVEDDIFTVTEEMAEAVQVYVDRVRGDYESFQIEYGEENVELLVETSFCLDWIDPELWGRNDAMIRVKGAILVVYDYKHGAGTPVEVKDNSQLRYYALGGIGEDKLLYRHINMVIVQPRCEHPDGPVREAPMTCGDLLFWGRTTLKKAVLATREPDAPLVAGEHCKKCFCPAQAICPEQRKQANAVARNVFSESPVEVVPAAPETLSPEELGLVLRKAKLVEAWLNSVRKYAQEQISSGSITPESIGFKMVAGRKSRKWKDEDEASDYLEAILGEDAFSKPKLLSPNQVEKLIRGKDIKELVATMTTETRGEQLAPISDKRPAITYSKAADVFDVVDV